MTHNEELYQDARRYAREHNLLWSMHPDDIRDYQTLKWAVNEVMTRNAINDPQARMFVNYMRDLLNKHVDDNYFRILEEMGA